MERPNFLDQMNRELYPCRRRPLLSISASCRVCGGAGTHCEQGQSSLFPCCVQKAVPPAWLDDFWGPGEVPEHWQIPCYGGCPLPASLPVCEHPRHAPWHTWCQGRFLCGFGSVQGRGKDRPMGSPGPVDLLWWVSSGSAPPTPNLPKCSLSLRPSVQPSYFPTEERLIPPLTEPETTFSYFREREGTS